MEREVFAEGMAAAWHRGPAVPSRTRLQVTMASNKTPHDKQDAGKPAGGDERARELADVTPGSAGNKPGLLSDPEGADPTRIDKPEEVAGRKPTMGGIGVPTERPDLDHKRDESLSPVTEPGGEKRGGG